MTKRESIMVALKTALVGTVGVAAANIFRSRVEPLSRADGIPAVTIEPIKDTATQDVIGFLDWLLTVRVGVFVVGAIPDQAADLIIESVHAKIMTDVSLGGLVLDIEPSSVNYEILEADMPIGIVTMDFNINYRTSVADVSA